MKIWKWNARLGTAAVLIRTLAAYNITYDRARLEGMGSEKTIGWLTHACDWYFDRNVYSIYTCIHNSSNSRGRRNRGHNIIIFIHQHNARVLTFTSRLFCTSPLLSENVIYCANSMKKIITLYLYTYIYIYIYTSRLELLVLQHIRLSLDKYMYTYIRTCAILCLFTAAAAASLVLSHIRSP